MASVAMLPVGVATGTRVKTQSSATVVLNTDGVVPAQLTAEPAVRKSSEIALLLLCNLPIVFPMIDVVRETED